MSTTRVAMTFVNRNWDPETIELVHAWDVDSLCENPGGYEESKQEAIKSLGSDLLRWVTVEVDVPDASIRLALDPAVQALTASEPIVTDGGAA